MTAQCSNCFYGRPVDGILACVKLAPNSISAVGRHVHVMARWLEVKPEYWCGDYAATDPNIYADTSVNVASASPDVIVSSAPAVVNVNATAPVVNVPAQTINVAAPTVSPTINAVAVPPDMVTGIAVVDFGSTPSSQATVVVEDQDIGAYSFVQAVINSRATADNNQIQHEMAGAFIRSVIQDIVPGIGFSIGCICFAGRATGKFKVDWAWRAA